MQPSTTASSLRRRKRSKKVWEVDMATNLNLRNPVCYTRVSGFPSLPLSRKLFRSLAYPAWFHEIAFIPLNNVSYSTQKPAGATDNS